MNPHGPGFLRSGRINRLYQRHVRGAADGKPFRENRGARKHAAVRALFVLQEGYFQPRLGERDLLEIVEIFDLLLNTQVQNSVCQGENSAAGPNLVRIGSSRKSLARLHLFGDGFSELINIDAGEVELPDLLLEGHPTQQIFHARADRLARIQVEGLV